MLDGGARACFHAVIAVAVVVVAVVPMSVYFQ